LHTTYTDGQCTVEDYFRCAAECGAERLVFLEHIRREPTYDVRRFAAEVRDLSGQYHLPAHVGFEAKILARGELDISPDHAALAEVIGIAEHSFRESPQVLAAAMNRVVATLRSSCRALLVWVHPGLSLVKGQRPVATDPIFLDLVPSIASQGVLIESNLRYGLLPRECHGWIAPRELVLGVDAHDLEAVRRWRECSDAPSIAAAHGRQDG
jgi:histidinol phosphatase-like PHP family hydrolase